MIKKFRFSEVNIDDLLFRNSKAKEVSDTVKEIIADVRKNGDEALMRYALKFDGAAPEKLEVAAREIDRAYDEVPKDLIATIEKAAENIREYHKMQLRDGYRIDNGDGRILGQKITPIEKVGIYIPGGTASYPSSVLMNAVPAKIAGCDEIIMISPPTRGGDIAPVILAAAKIAGIDRIFRTGGAQGVAALAYGTKSIPKVYKITGPGNAFVAEAKRQVYGEVDIDTIAGPSEVLVVADAKSDPVYVAADMLSQAEHDKMASAVLITDSDKLADEVADEIEKQLCELPREEIARASIENNGKIIITDDIKEAIDVANELAPEHLELVVDDPFDFLDQVRNAGSVFMGRYCPEPLGDYLSGTNHTLPTEGRAKYASALGVDDFIKKVQYTYYTRDALSEVYKDIDRFAKAEGLDAHAKAAVKRFE